MTTTPHNIDTSVVDTAEVRKYGCKKGIIKDSDSVIIFKPKCMGAPVPKKDLIAQMPPIYDQSCLGSCTANAIGAAYQYARIKQKEPNPEPISRLMLYLQERDIEGTIDVDEGAQICTGVQCISNFGTCPERMWPYDISKFNIKPPVKCYQSALNHKCTKNYRISNDPMQIKQAILNNLPIILGILVYKSFESAEVAKTGIVNMPDISEECRGGHAVLLVGYDDTIERYIMRNSWGENWGQKGYFTIPYQYIHDPTLTNDLWVLVTVFNDNSNDTLNVPCSSKNKLKRSNSIMNITKNLISEVKEGVKEGVEDIFELNIVKNVKNLF